MFHLSSLRIAVWLLAGGSLVASAAESKPLRALLITGGCCHNYPFQSRQLTNALGKLAAVEWRIVQEGGNGTRGEISLYDNPDWAKGFDVVVHNECFADTTSPDYIRRITAAHKAGVPAVTTSSTISPAALSAATRAIN